MLNCEKSILVVYVNTKDMSKDKGMIALAQIRNHIESQFINEKEINDDSLVIIVLPSDKMDVREKIINDYLNENLKK